MLLTKEKDQDIHLPQRQHQQNEFWIEILLDTPIGDYKKNALRRTVAPYLINIKKLSYDEAFNITKDWLKKCDKIIPLQFNVNAKIKDTRNKSIVLSFHYVIGVFPIG